MVIVDDDDDDDDDGAQGTLICIFFPYTAGDDHSNFSRVTHKYHCPCYDLQKPEWNLF